MEGWWSALNQGESALVKSSVTPSGLADSLIRAEVNRCSASDKHREILSSPQSCTGSGSGQGCLSPLIWTIITFFPHVFCWICLRIRTSDAAVKTCIHLVCSPTNSSSVGMSHLSKINRIFTGKIFPTHGIQVWRFFFCMLEDSSDHQHTVWEHVSPCCSHHMILRPP